MSSFGAKRKPRIIQTLDDEDADLGPKIIGGEEPKKDGEYSLLFFNPQHTKPSC